MDSAVGGSYYWSFTVNKFGKPVEFPNPPNYSTTLF